MFLYLFHLTLPIQFYCFFFYFKCHVSFNYAFITMLRLCPSSPKSDFGFSFLVQVILDFATLLYSIMESY